MRNKRKLMGLLIACVLSLTYLLPIAQLHIYASGYLSITEIKQGGSTLQQGDNFTLTVSLASSYIDTEEISDIDNFFHDLYEISVTGSAVKSSNVIYTPEYTTRPDEPSRAKINTIKIQGLQYTGIGDKVSVYIGTKDDQYGSATGEVTLDCMTIEESKDAFKIEDTSNILIKTNTTQNAQVKVVNQGKQTLKNVKVQLQLTEKVEGIKIKTEEAIISQLQPKEIKGAVFSIEVDEDVKAKVYTATATVNGASFPVNLQVDSHIVPSVIEISTEMNKVFTPGVAQDVTITLKNVGERPAKNIRVEVNSEHVAVVGGSNVKHIPVINAKSVNEIMMKIRVDSKFKDSSVPLKIDMTYLNSLGEQAKDTQYIYLATTSSGIASEVIIDDIISPVGTFGVDENFTVKFNVSTKGEADNLKIAVKGGDGIVPKSQNLFFISKLAAGEKKQYTVTLAATRSAVSSTHPIEIKIEYGDGANPITLSQYSSVNVTNPEKDNEGSENKKGTPKVIIGHYKSEPVVVRAGEEFELEIGFLNAHKDQSVHNLKANLTIREEGENGTGSVFTPVRASNTFYISDLLARQTEVKKITLYTIPSAKPKTYEITIEMEYEDDKGNAVKATENIGIPVEQTTKIEIGDIQVDYAQIGVPTYFNATIYNTGKTNISNMMIYIEGENFRVEDNKMFVGNFERGATENYAPTLIAEMAGQLTGNMIVEYEEATGERQKISKEFTLEVEEMMEPSDMPMGDPGMMEPSQAPKLPTVIGMILGFVMAVGVTVWRLKKRKAKKEKMMFDEDE